jgi:hypothetical protein
MSKDLPWVDIYTEDEWSRFVVQFKKKKIGLKSGSGVKALLEGVKLGFHQQEHNEFLTLLGQMIKSYHGVEKRKAETLDLRAGMLESIAADSEKYMKKQGIKREDTAKASLGYLLLKLARRARRKAAYIRELKKHCKDAKSKAFKGYNDLLGYLFENRFDDDLASLHAGVRMERLDPWHRVFEMNIKRDYYGGIRTENPTGYMDGALALWLGSSQHDDTPFFVWLEGNYVCTGVDDDGTLNKDYRGIPEDRKPHRGVTYLKRDDALLLMVNIKGGLAYPALQRFDTNQPNPVLMDECPTSDFSKEPGAYAYVWTKDGLILCHNHVSGAFHHSSLASGHRVRCAGMIGFTQGKVTLLSNDSGHYRPSNAMLGRFADYLKSEGVLDPYCRFKPTGV